MTTATAAAGSIPASPEAGYAVPFSLFDGDWLNRQYVRLGMGRGTRFALLKRCVVAIVLTYVPIALLALVDGSYGGGATATNFFADFAAYIANS